MWNKLNIKIQENIFFKIIVIMFSILFFSIIMNLLLNYGQLFGTFLRQVLQ